jgi:hypothetical protein
LSSKVKATTGTSAGAAAAAILALAVKLCEFVQGGGVSRLLRVKRLLAVQGGQARVKRTAVDHI